MRKFLISRSVHAVLLILVLLGLASLRQTDYSLLASLHNATFDSFNVFYPRVSNGQVVIVDIDEASLQDNQFGQWPWPRYQIARLVDKLSALGAKTIVFDMTFSERDRSSPAELLKTLPDSPARLDLKKLLETYPDHDSLLAQSILASKRVVTGFTAAAGEYPLPILRQKIVVSPEASPVFKHSWHIQHAASNLDALESVAAGNGCFCVKPDLDGIIRRVPLFIKIGADNDDDESGFYPSLALEGARVSVDRRAYYKVRALTAQEFTQFSYPFLVMIGPHNIPLDAQAMFRVHYDADQSGHYISVRDVMSGNIDSARIDGKIVLVGTSAAGLRDIRSTPLNLYIPGVAVHRNIIEQILDGHYITRPDGIYGAELMLAFFSGLVIIGLTPFINSFLLTCFTTLIVAGEYGTALYLYVYHGMQFDPVYPSICLSVVFVLATLLHYIRTESERHSIETAFGLYISPDYMNELTQNPEQLRLGGETREITVMFTDIRGFTSLSEHMTPDALVQLMNDFLTPMSDEVMKYRGTIDKYMGDAMMAFWNAPLKDEQHARHAAQAALAMNRALAPLNARLQSEAQMRAQAPLLLKAGIGVNTGAAAVGNMGSKQRFAYSAMGDAVNLASRLEGQTKEFGVDILIGEATYAAIPDFAALELDLIRVKGKTLPVRIYGLFSETQDELFKTLILPHMAMLDLYRSGKWDEARALISQCRSLGYGPMANYYILLEKRIAALAQDPPPLWDGVFEAKTK